MIVQQTNSSYLTRIGKPPEGLYKLRIRRGWTHHRAIRDLPNPMSVTFNGSRKSFVEHSKAMNLDITVVYKRYYKLGWTIAQTFGTTNLGRRRTTVSRKVSNYNYNGLSIIRS